MYNLIYEMISLIIPIVLTPYVSRVLGATAIGDYSYTVGIVSYFEIFAITGTKNYAKREIGANQNNKYLVSKIFWEIFIFRIICTIAVGFIYTIFILGFLGQYRSLFFIQGFNFLAWMLDIGWLFQGIEKFKVTVTRNCIVKILCTILIFVWVKKPEDLWLYTFIFVMSNVIGNITMWFPLKKEIIFIPFSKLEIFKNIKGILGLFIPVISIQIYTILDKTMLGTLCNTTEVGYYTQAEKIIKLALTVISSLIVVLMPRISLLYNNGDVGKIQLYCQKTLRYIFMLATPMLIGCILISDVFVPVFFGKGYDRVIPLMQILSFLFIILSLGQFFGSVLVAVKREKVYTVAVTSAAIVNMILNYIFLQFFHLGAIGVCVATLIAETVSTVLQLCYILDFVKIKYIIRALLKYAKPNMVLFLIIMIVRNLINNNWLLIIVSLMVGISGYFLTLILFKDELVYSVFTGISKKLKKE